MFEDKSRNMCPVCKCIYIGEERLHRHIEEKHDNLAGSDTELMENISGKELLNE